MASRPLDTLCWNIQDITHVLGKVSEKPPKFLFSRISSLLRRSETSSKGKKSGNFIFSLPRTYQKTLKMPRNNLSDNRKMSDKWMGVLFQSYDLQASFPLKFIKASSPDFHPVGSSRPGACGRWEQPWAEYGGRLRGHGRRPTPTPHPCDFCSGRILASQMF